MLIAAIQDILRDWLLLLKVLPFFIMKQLLIRVKQNLLQITGHSTTLDAARTALEAGAGTLLIGHFSARYRNIHYLLKRHRSIFPRYITQPSTERLMISGILIISKKRIIYLCVH